MSSRGRSRRAKSPDCRPAKTIPRSKEEKKDPPTRCPAFIEKQKEVTETKKARDQKIQNHTDEMPSARTRKGKTTNHDTVETNEQNGIPNDRTKAKTCSTRIKEQQFPEATENMPPDTPNEPGKNSKSMKCVGNTKSAEESGEEAESPDSMPAKNATRRKVINTNPEHAEHNAMPTVRPKAKTCSTKTTKQKSAGEAEKTPLDKPKNTAKNSEATESAGRAKFPEESKEKTTVQLGKLKGTTKTCGGRAKAAETLPEEKVPSILKDSLHNLRIKKEERSNTSLVVNGITKHIIDHLKKTESFKDVDEPLRTGSYYEYVKISNPDEFDVMLPIPVERAQLKPFGDDGAFYSVELKRGKNPLNKFQNDDVLSASQMLLEFREEVKKCLKEFTEWSMEKKKKGCPAVTITRTVGSICISLDVVLCIKVKSRWPDFTADGLKIEKWLGTKVKRDHKLKPYYLVPKYEGIGTNEKEGVLAKDVWRVSFSHVEKDILKNHGSEKTCCEKEGLSCCRKDCLKLLKHLLHLLKEKNQKNFDKFCSYHAKTTLLHACCSRPDDSEWKAVDLNTCFKLLLQDFVTRLQEGQLNNFFIPSQNLLSGPTKKMCNELAECIKYQCEKGFPIFEEELKN